MIKNVCVFSDLNSLLFIASQALVTESPPTILLSLQFNYTYFVFVFTYTVAEIKIAYKIIKISLLIIKIEYHRNTYKEKINDGYYPLVYKRINKYK